MSSEPCVTNGGERVTVRLRDRVIEELDGLDEYDNRSEAIRAALQAFLAGQESEP